MKKICLALAVLLSILLIPDQNCHAQAEEELAPGFNECASDTMGKAMARHCYLEAEKYWGKKLDVAYRQLLANCSRATSPEKCKKKVRQMERSWLEYQKLMAELLFYGGTDEIANPNPDIDEYINNGEFLAKSTRDHYRYIHNMLNGS